MDGTYVLRVRSSSEELYYPDEYGVGHAGLGFGWQASEAYTPAMSVM